MTTSSDILISLKPEHAGNVLSGKKRVELRKRQLHIEPGTTIWLYVTAPVSALRGYATVDDIVRSSPDAIWKNFGRETAISKSEFDAYFSDSTIGYALFLTEVKVLNHPIPLIQLKKKVSGFHPPQFFCRLNGAVASWRLRSKKYKAAPKY